MKKNKIPLTILLCNVILTFFLPIVMLPFNVLGMVLAKGRTRKTYGFLTAFSLAIVAYAWTPNSEMDLYRHHQQVAALADFDFAQLGAYIKADLEPAHYMVDFLVAQTGDKNLLQFVVVLCGYSELFWLLCDWAETRSIKKSWFVLATVYAFFSVRFIDFASGLWCNLAIINIALGAYLDYFKKKKYAPYILYALAACLHTGTIYVVVLVMAFSKIRLFKKIRSSVLATIAISILAIGGVMWLLNSILGGSALMTILNRMYNAYFVNGEQYASLHTGWNLVLSLAKMALGLAIGAWYYKKNDGEKREYGSLVTYLAVSIIATTLGAGVFVRYGFLLAILSVPMIVDFLDAEKDRVLRLMLIGAMMLIASFEAVRTVSQINQTALVQNIGDNVANGVMQLMEKSE